MTLEHQIAELTQAVKENTAALREILSVGATTAADTLVPAAPKKRAAKLAVVEPEPEPECPAPVAEETPEENGGSDLDIEPAEEDCGGTVEAAPEVPDLPVAELRNSLKESIKGKLLADTEGVIKPIFDALRAKYGGTVEAAPEVPDLPVAELRNSLKESIKGKLLADTEGVIKPIFDALRAKYGVAVIKELTDDQVAPFYGEVLTWG